MFQLRSNGDKQLIGHEGDFILHEYTVEVGATANGIERNVQASDGTIAGQTIVPSPNEIVVRALREMLHQFNVDGVAEFSKYPLLAAVGNLEIRLYGSIKALGRGAGPATEQIASANVCSIVKSSNRWRRQGNQPHHGLSLVSLIYVSLHRKPIPFRQTPIGAEASVKKLPIV